MPVLIGCQTMVRSGKQRLNERENPAQLPQHESQEGTGMFEVYFRAPRGVL